MTTFCQVIEVIEPIYVIETKESDCQIIVQELGGLQVVEVGISGPQGPPGPAGVSDLELIPFSYGDASPRIVLNLLSNQTVLQVNCNITEPFNGAGASFALGTFAQPDVLVAPAQIDLGIPTEFEINPNVLLTAPIDIVLTLVPGAGATQGAGWFVIERVSS